MKKKLVALGMAFLMAMSTCMTALRDTGILKTEGGSTGTIQVLG